VLKPQLMQPVFLETKVKEQMKNDNSKFELARMQNVPQILKVLYVHEKKNQRCTVTPRSGQILYLKNTVLSLRRKHRIFSHLR